MNQERLKIAQSKANESINLAAVEEDPVVAESYASCSIAYSLIAITELMLAAQQKEKHAPNNE